VEGYLSNDHHVDIDIPIQNLTMETRTEKVRSSLYVYDSITHFYVSIKCRTRYVCTSINLNLKETLYLHNTNTYIIMIWRV